MKIFLALILFLVTKQEQVFYVWRDDIEQQRPIMVLDERLTNAANYKAQLLAESGIIAHCINGYCPNQMIKDFGCLTDYKDMANDVESILIGERNPADVINHFRNSPEHRVHIFGEEDRFKYQDDIGVGYYEKNNNFYYVFISAHCKE